MGKNKELGHLAIDVQVKTDKIDRQDKINSSKQFFLNLAIDIYWESG